ncbi:molecular chaperone DnaJ, partial [Patescibacteria group bacterium]
CTSCKGAGQVRQNMQSFIGIITQVVTCPTCRGKGKTFSKKCHKCGGDGRTKGEAEIPIEIPAGIESGQTISVRGQGEAGASGAPSGDLLATVHVKPHSKFKRERNDIVSEEYISVSQATLGDKIDVETIDGRVTMKVPEGTQSGEVFRIKEHGVPFLGKRSRGNHLVKLVVRIPKRLSREERKLFEDLKKSGQ